MTTTVQVKQETKKLLEGLKKNMGARSYDEVIGNLARKRADVPESMFGSLKGSKPFRRENEDEHQF